MKINKLEGEWIWISFKYELLLTFCYLCGKRSHSDHLCTLLFDQSPLPLQCPYGLCLRAAGQCSSQAIGDRQQREGSVAVTVV